MADGGRGVPGACRGPDALGAVELVRADAEKVDPELVHLDGDLACGEEGGRGPGEGEVSLAGMT